MSGDRKRLASDADFELCNSIAVVIPEYYGSEAKAGDLPVPHRTVLLVWSAMGVIDNGGFEYLFEHRFPGDPMFKYTVAAFDEIGCTAATDAFHAAFAQFPNGRLIEDREARGKHYESLPETTRLSISRAFWKVSDCGKGEICVRLAKYIRQNDAAFAGLKSKRSKQ